MDVKQLGLNTGLSGLRSALAELELTQMMNPEKRLIHGNPKSDARLAKAEAKRLRKQTKRKPNESPSTR
jgi:hypothetical protein